jgi:hypothetical protein
MRQALASAAIQSSSANWCAIVGAPRCGTTSLGRYLSGHPNICFANVKEPHFFSRYDLWKLPRDEITDFVTRRYLDRFFPNAADDDLMVEASVSYLYAPDQILPVLRIWPNAKFIVAVRNPIEMLPSLHQRHVFNGDETVRDFERAWSLVEDRRCGRHVPRTCVDPRLLDYKEIGKLGKYVRRFLDVVGRERCFISIFDDLIASPSEQYRHVLEFLDLPADFRTDFGVYRASAQVKVAWLQRLLKRPPKLAQSLLASDADLHREGKRDRFRTDGGGYARHVKRVRKQLLKWNRTSARPKSLSPQLQRAMCDWFREDVADLSSLIGRDLSHWLSPIPDRLQ